MKFTLTPMMNLNAELEQDDLTILFDEHVLRMSPLVIAAHIMCCGKSDGCG